MLLKVSGVSYRYRKTDVLSDVSFQSGMGVVGLLGPNGAGKSTLLDILAHVRRPLTGSIQISVHGSRERTTEIENRKMIGYLPQRFSTDRFMSVQRHVEYAAWLHGVPNDECASFALKALEIVDLSARASKPARSLSGGQVQRLGIACAIVHKPQIVLLDEPTVGLDPIQRIEFRSYLRDLAKTTSILLSTHLVEDIENIAEKILVLSEGKIIFDDSVSALANLAKNTGLAMSPLESGYYSVLRGNLENENH
jgi:ABC-2 type transport system ATP-binding protein